MEDTIENNLMHSEDALYMDTKSFNKEDANDENSLQNDENNEQNKLSNNKDQVEPT